MKPITEKQLKRRQGVLAAARQLLAEHGYDGVTMRLLAAECGVSTKFLYDTYASKDDLLAKAIAERLELVYERIEGANLATGAAHIAYLCDGIADSMFEIPNFAHAFAASVLSDKSINVRDPGSVAVIRRCVQEIQADGELLPSADMDVLARMIQFQLTFVIWQWHVGTVSDANLRHFFKLAAGNVLKTLTTGNAEALFLKLEQDAYAAIGARVSF